MVQRKSRIWLLYIVTSMLGFALCQGENQNNQKLVGKVFYYNDRTTRTLLNCKCCNTIQSPLFLITDQDTIQLYGMCIDSLYRIKKKSNQDIFDTETLSITKKRCPLFFTGKECEPLKNSQFEANKEYEITGSFIFSERKTSNKAFFVVNRIIIEK
jgi:hypothetical protein